MSKAMRYLKQIDKKRSASSATLSHLGRMSPPTEPVHVAPVLISTTRWADTRTDPAQDLRDVWQTMREYNAVADYHKAQKILEYIEKRSARSK